MRAQRRRSGRGDRRQSVRRGRLAAGPAAVDPRLDLLDPGRSAARPGDQRSPAEADGARAQGPRRDRARPVSLKLAAVVLAGGEGRRMGGGKPLKPWRGGTLVSHALEKARGYAPRVAVAVRTPDQAGSLDAPSLTDPPDIAGPLAGLSSALAFAAEEGVDAVLTLPC